MLFRDYGLYDHAMLRFSGGHKLSDNFYVRQDGTRAYYFSEGIITCTCNSPSLVPRLSLPHVCNYYE